MEKRGIGRIHRGERRVPRKTLQEKKRGGGGDLGE